MKRILISIFFPVLFITSHAQYFETGQDPSYIRWRQLQTKNFKLVYPDYYEEQAQDLADKLEAVYPYGSFSLKHNPQRLPVVLHTQTIKSNGLVAWAPKRAEFYTTPHQSAYPQDWLEQLALHEFRHIVQVDKVNSLLPEWLRVLLGEQVTALTFGGYLPWWFIEGDAVVTETALSNYGRGRFPSFLMEHRAQVVEKGIYSYDKAYLGSYRDYVPNHYKLGYYLVGEARARYGIDLWEDVLFQTGNKPFSVIPFKKALKRNTGFNRVQLYRSVFDSLQTIWKETDQQFEPSEFKIISSTGKFFTSYNYNHWFNDSTVISLKTSFDQIPVFIKSDQNGKEKKILFPGTIFNESAGFRNEWIVWSEQIPDTRWNHSGRSLIMIRNAISKKKIKIKPGFKSFSPSISPDKEKVVVVEADFSNNYYLTGYSIPEGEMVFRFQTLDNNYFFMPEWLNNKEIAVIILTDEGKRLARIDPVEGVMDILFENDLGDLKHLRAKGNMLYFISSYSGKNSLYRMNLNDNSVERVFEPRFGVESPAISPDGSRIILSDYTADGFRLIRIPARHDGIIPLTAVKRGEYPLAEKLAKQEPGIPPMFDFETKNYQSERYSKSSNLFNFHSWAPVYIDADNYEFSPGVSLMSQNILGTSETVAGYRWNETEKTGRFLLNYTYKGFYPQFDINLSTGKRKSKYTMITQTVNPKGEVIRQDTSRHRFTWGETRAGANIKLPLNFTKGMFHRFLQPELQYDLTYYRSNVTTPENFRTGGFNTLGYRLYFYQLLRNSYLDMFPDIGFVLDGVFRHTPFSQLDAGRMMALQSVLYLPGIMKNHGIKLYGGTQRKESNGSLDFHDVVRYARGWGSMNTARLTTVGADYKLPLFYPDCNILGILYMQRVKSSLFADYSRIQGNIYDDGEKTGIFKDNLSSVGIELTADVNFLRFYAPSEIGIRTSCHPEINDITFEFLFSIDFNSF